MWYDGFNSSKKRGQTSFIIPAWKKGDRVMHRPTGFYGQLLEMQTAGGELWKMRPDCQCGGGKAAEALGLCKPGPCVTVHACDLELRT